jgi:hypothetical protein
MGPFKDIGKFLMVSNGPIQGYQQFLSWAILDPFKDIGKFLMVSNGPIQGYQQFLS